MIKRIFIQFLLIIAPGKYRANIIKKLKVFNHIGENVLFCTSKIGTEPGLITIGNDVIIASDTQFVNHDMSLTTIDNYFKSSPKTDHYGEIVIGSNVFVGASSILMPDINICDDVIIGSGSIVKSNINKKGVYAGIGPKFICSLDEYKEKLNLKQNKSLYLEEKFPNFFDIKEGKLFKKKDFLI